MTVQMKLKEFSQLLNEAVFEGTQKTLVKCGVLSDNCTKAEAYRFFGRSDVDRWIAEGLITPAIKNGKVSKKCIDRIKLEQVAASSNRITYLPVAER